jgi:hypothetical protein
MTFALPSLNALETITKAADTVVTYGARVYALGSEIFTVSTLLWTLNFLAISIERTYSVGEIAGAFYFKHLHSHIKSLLRGALALGIVLGIYFIATAKKAYSNRKEIAAKLNSIRSQIGNYFVYA